VGFSRKFGRKEIARGRYFVRILVGRRRRSQGRDYVAIFQGRRKRASGAILDVRGPACVAQAAAVSI
jgi:hypothetical protein